MSDKAKNRAKQKSKTRTGFQEQQKMYDAKTGEEITNYAKSFDEVEKEERRLKRVRGKGVARADSKKPFTGKYDTSPYNKPLEKKFGGVINTTVVRGY